MKVLVAHNFYQQPGGEDQCLAAEVAMLRAHGHEVTQYCVHNDLIAAMNRLQVASRTIWSQSAFRELRRLFRTHRPQIAHFHNTLPLISPAAYYAARAENVRVVQTLQREDAGRAKPMMEERKWNQSKTIWHALGVSAFAAPIGLMCTAHVSRNSTVMKCVQLLMRSRAEPLTSFHSSRCCLHGVLRGT
jgi:hypothetical protein